MNPDEIAKILTEDPDVLNEISFPGEEHDEYQRGKEVAADMVRHLKQLHIDEPVESTVEEDLQDNLHRAEEAARTAEFEEKEMYYRGIADFIKNYLGRTE